MISLTLSEKEVEMLRMSVKHCIETCHEGGPSKGCPNCQTLEEILGKL